ncbi:MAG: prepilin-type N-terminal cleavage/methylation domain-containing protein [Deltaproteobacteria bacterium]
MMLRSDAAGFTLVELLVVLVLISFLSSVVFISVSSGILKSEKTRFLTTFSQGLVHARTASLGRGETVRFEIDSAERSFSVAEKTLGEIPETLQIEANGALTLAQGRYGIAFYPDGSSSGGEIDITENGSLVERITIDKILGIIKREAPGS